MSKPFFLCCSFFMFYLLVNCFFGFPLILLEDSPWRYTETQQEGFRGWSWWLSIVAHRKTTFFLLMMMMIVWWWWWWWSCKYPADESHQWRWIQEWQFVGKRRGVGEVSSRVTQWPTNVRSEWRASSLSSSPWSLPSLSASSAHHHFHYHHHHNSALAALRVT